MTMPYNQQITDYQQGFTAAKQQQHKLTTTNVGLHKFVLHNICEKDSAVFLPHSNHPDESKKEKFAMLGCQYPVENLFLFGSTIKISE